MLYYSIHISILIYILGIIMYLINKNLIYILISLEILLFSISLISLQISFIIDDMIGSLISIYILPLAGIESALGLCLLIKYYPIRGNINIWYLKI